MNNKRLELDLSKKYGKLQIIKEVNSKRLPCGQTNRVVLCKCDCGNEKEIRLLHLHRNRTISCGCEAKTRNGLSLHPLYKVWQSILIRTTKESNTVYSRKNIKCCKEWQTFENFYKWSIENGYKKGLHIDRIDGNKNYEPLNCRYITPRENTNNRENTFFVDYNGKKEPFTKILIEQDKLKSYTTIIRRIKRGWNHQKAIDTEIRKLESLQ